jgi:hypothetical protein
MLRTKLCILGCTCQLSPSFVLAKPAAWKLRSFRLRGDASYPMLAFNGFSREELAEMLWECL